MSPADFILAFLSIVLALALQEVLQGLGALIRSGRARELPVAHYLFALSLVFLMIQFWWTMWFWRVIPTWAVQDFVLMLIALTLLYLLAIMVFPEEGVEDHGNYYMEFAGRLWMLLVLHVAAVTAAVSAVLEQRPPFFTSLLPTLILAAVALIVSRSRSRLVHGAASALLAGFNILLLTMMAPLEP